MAYTILIPGKKSFTANCQVSTEAVNRALVKAYGKWAAFKGEEYGKDEKGNTTLTTQVIKYVNGWLNDKKVIEEQITITIVEHDNLNRQEIPKGKSSKLAALEKVKASLRKEEKRRTELAKKQAEIENQLIDLAKLIKKQEEKIATLEAEIFIN